MNRLAICGFILLLSACSRGQDVYAPPIPRQPLDSFGSNPARHFVLMKDAGADPYLVRDVSKSIEGDSWRWTYRHPELRFYLDSTKNVTFKMDFAISPQTFQQTGPVTLTYSINGKPLDKVTYSEPRSFHFEKAVPEAMLVGNSFNSVTIDPDKVYTAPADGALLGFVLTGAGFVQ